MFDFTNYKYPLKDLGYVYILKLEHNCYYIGSSFNPEDRILRHVRGVGTEWTKIHKPVEIISIERRTQDDLENIRTLEYATKFGIVNVRGGDFAQLNLSDARWEKFNKAVQDFKTNVN